MNMQLAVMPVKLTKLAIVRKLNNPQCVVECAAEIGGKFKYWRRIGRVVCDDGPMWKGLWVQELNGLGAWFSPKEARWRLLQEGEKPTPKS